MNEPSCAAGSSDEDSKLTQVYWRVETKSNCSVY